MILFIFVKMQDTVYPKKMLSNEPKHPSDHSTTVYTQMNYHRKRSHL